MERDEARQAHAELMQVAGEKYEALRDRAKTAAAGLGGKNDRLAAELAALRAAVTGLADEWLQEGAASARQQFGEETTDAQAERLRLRAIQFKAQSDRVRALLTDEGDNG